MHEIKKISSKMTFIIHHSIIRNLTKYIKQKKAYLHV